jgi:hypothetical protein
MRTVIHPKIARNPFLAEAARMRRELIRQAKVEGDVGFLRYLRRQEAEARREVMRWLAMRSRARTRPLIVVPPRRLQRHAARHTSSSNDGEDVDAR